MKKVLHYKTNFLNKSETFIQRLTENHQNYTAAAFCYRKKELAGSIPVFESPKKGFESIKNSAAFHANLPLPFYRKIVSEQKPNIIHAHFGYDAYKMVKIARAENIPLVTSFYGSDVSRLPSELFWEKRYNKLAESGAYFIAASDFMKHQLTELGFPQEKIGTVRFGLHPEEFSFESKKPNQNNIMMVGRLVEKKGFEYAIRAVAQLKNHGFEPDVNIYGDGPLMNGLKQLASDLNLDDQIHFHGFLPNNKISLAHQKHSIILAPSVTASDGDMEGLPNTILEAMASGTVVVATKHAAIPEAIHHKETGFLAKESDINELSGILIQIFQGRFDLEQIRKKARITIEQQYTIKKMVSDTEQIYDRFV